MREREREVYCTSQSTVQILTSPRSRTLYFFASCLKRSRMPGSLQSSKASIQHSWSQFMVT